MGDSGRLSWPADFSDDSCEYVHYDYFGSWSEVPANLVIPREKDLAAAKSFLEGYSGVVLKEYSASAAVMVCSNVSRGRR